MPILPDTVELLHEAEGGAELWNVGGTLRVDLPACFVDGLTLAEAHRLALDLLALDYVADKVAEGAVAEMLAAS